MNRTDERTKKRSAGLSMSKADIELLGRVADFAYGGNSSLAVRAMTKDKARALGLITEPVESQPQAVV